MSNDSSSVSDILSKINDERRAEQLEREIRYASRKGIKFQSASLSQAAVLCIRHRKD